MFTGNNSTVSRLSICLAASLFNCFDAIPQVDTTDYVVEPAVTEDADWIEYHGGFDFREGIYRAFSEFRMNAPSLPSGAFLDSEGRPIGDLTTHDGRVFYRDTLGKGDLKTVDRFWGFCNNDVVYIGTRDGYQRIGLIGSLCHMVVQEWQVSGSFGENVPVAIQRLMNMRTGTFEVFNASSLAMALSNDTTLYQEFLAIPPRQRNRDVTLFQFLRRYNERNPLRFPPS